MRALALARSRSCSSTTEACRGQMHLEFWPLFVRAEQQDPPPYVIYGPKQGIRLDLRRATKLLFW